MKACVKSYDLQSIENWSSKVLDILKYEVLNVVEEELAQEALATLAAVGSRLGSDITPETLDGSPLMRYVHEVIKDFDSYLMDARQKFVPQSGRILTCVAASSNVAFDMIIKQVMPRLQTVLGDMKSIDEKNGILVIILSLLNAKYALLMTPQPEKPEITMKKRASVDRNRAYGGQLELFRDSLFELFSSMIIQGEGDETPLRITGIHGLLQLVLLPKFLSEAEVGMVVSHFCDVVINTGSSGDLQEEAITALKQVAISNTTVINAVAMPQLVATLPESLVNNTEEKKCRVVIEALATIASQSDLYSRFNEISTQKFLDVLTSNAGQLYARLILAGLLRAMQLRQSSSSVEKRNNDVEEFRLLVQGLYRSVLEVRTIDRRNFVGLQALPVQHVADPKVLGSKEIVYPDDATLELIGKIAMTAVQFMTVNEQTWAALEIFTLFTEVKVPESIASRTRNQIVASSKNLTSKKTLTLSMYLMAGLHPEVFCTLSDEWFFFD
jgi:hypothetical protein